MKAIVKALTAFLAVLLIFLSWGFLGYWGYWWIFCRVPAGDLFVIGRVLDPNFEVSTSTDASKFSFLSYNPDQLHAAVDWLTNNNPIVLKLVPPGNGAATNTLNDESYTNVVTFLGNLLGSHIIITKTNNPVPRLRLRSATQSLLRENTNAMRLDFLLLEDASRAAPFHKEGPERYAPRAVIIFYVIILSLLTWRGCIILLERRTVKAFTDGEPKWNKKGYEKRDARIKLIDKRLSLNDARERLADISGLDICDISGIYSPIKIAIWILPVLGFIGTAFGMSAAISGFSEALGEGNDAMTGTLGHIVIPGLAGAFYTTIAALLAAVVCHFCATLFQGYEDDMVDQLDKWCLEKIETNNNTTETSSLNLLELEQKLDGAQKKVQSADKTIQDILKDMEILKKKKP